jgi:amidohydrolase
VVELPDLTALVAPHERELIALRRVLHSQPELSGEEKLTTGMLVERLMVEGLTPIVLNGGTGLVCDISLDPAAHPDASTMPVVALRADLDALAMQDLTTTPYRSTIPGLAHACGHDVHTAIALGAGLALLDIRRASPVRGVVRLVFEPCEEVVPGGAVDVINEGWLDHVTAIFGVHCDPKLDVGLLGLRVGPLTSAADRFEIHLSGPGGHTARPHLTVDLVRWAGRIADRLADTVRAITDADVSVVLGSIHSGAAANVIPATAVLGGSLRTPDRDAWLNGPRLLDQAVRRIIEHDGPGSPPRWNVDYVHGVPPLVNDADTIALATSVAREIFGPQSVADTPQSMGADSFAWYTERIPGAYVRLGTHDPAAGEQRVDLHSANFDVDENAIAIGAALLAGCALAALTRT